MEKKRQNFNLPRVTIDKLEEMARARGLTKTVIVMLAIDEMYRDRHLDNSIDNQERAPARLEDNP